MAVLLAVVAAVSVSAGVGHLRQAGLEKGEYAEAKRPRPSGAFAVWGATPETVAEPPPGEGIQSEGTIIFRKDGTLELPKNPQQVAETNVKPAGPVEGGR